IAKNLVDKLIEGSPSKFVQTIPSLLRLPYSLGRGLLSAGGRQSKALAVNSYNMDFDPASVNLRMSGFSRYIVQNLDIPGIARKRHLNAKYLNAALKSISGVRPFFTDLPDGVCPWGFPILADGRRNFHLELRSRGIPAYTWGYCIHP